MQRNYVSGCVLALLLLIGAHAVAQTAGAAKSPKKASSAGASLDALASRVDGYWKALLQKKKGLAAEYVAPADRERFYGSDIPSFSNPYLKSLELSADRKEALVTVIATRISPLGTKMEWPVTDRWRFEKGNWYRTIPDKPRMILPGMERAESPSTEDVEALENEIRKLFRIENSVLDFGTVRESTPLQLSLKYTLLGQEPLGAAIKIPAGFGIQGGDRQVLNPGEHELRIIVPTWQLDGEVHERIVLNVLRRKATVPYEIEVKGRVYVPVSIAPKTLKFQRGESEKGVRIRNNSKSGIELLSFYSETRQVLVQPLPVTIPPGQEIELKVVASKESDSLRANLTDSLSISLKEPADGVNSLSLSIVLNSEAPAKGGKPAGGNEEIAPILSDRSQSCPVPPDMRQREADWKQLIKGKD